MRGYIGASVQMLTPKLAEGIKLKGQLTGALVKDFVCLLRSRLRSIRALEPQSVSCDSTQGNPGRWRVEEDQQYENI